MYEKFLLKLVGNFVEKQTSAKGCIFAKGVQMFRNEGLIARDCNILLVEDCSDSQEIFTHVLRKIGANITWAKNGKECVELAIDALEKNKGFDVILMDIQMPIMDGHTAARTLRQSGYKLPILAMTARSGPNDKEESEKAGCDGHISKLSGMNGLISEVKKQIHKSKTFDIEIPVLPLVPQFLRDNPSYAELALVVISNLDTKIVNLKKMILEADYSGIKEISNQLGNLSLYGYSQFSSIINEIQLFAEKQDQSGIEHKVEVLERSAKAIIAGIPQLKKAASLV